MNGWSYRAHTIDGQLREGIVQAITLEDATRNLVRRRLIPEFVRPAPKARGSIQFRSQPKTVAMVLFARQFSTLIDAGVPLVQSLEVLKDLSADKVLQKALDTVIVDVQSGKSLAEAMKEHPKVFNEIFISMIEAGERGGVLDTIMARLATYLEKSQAIVSKVKTAMVYPTVILFVAIGSAIVMLTFVVPSFQTMFDAGGLSLPYPTQVLLNLSQFFENNWLWVTLGIGAGVVFVRQFYKTPPGRAIIDQLLIHIPVLGDLIKKTAVARYSQSMSSLLKAGVNLIDALTSAAATANNVVIEKALLGARTAIESGEGISKPLGKIKMLPRLVPRMLEVGEQTGQLDEMFEKIALFYESEVDTAVERLMKVLEPAMLVIVGGILGAMVVALYLPIFEAMTSIAPE